MTAQRPSSWIFAFAVVAVAACRQAPPPVPGPRVERPDLGIALASVPTPFELEASAATGIVLVVRNPEGDGRLSIEAGPAEPGAINLVEQVEKRKAVFEGLPEGEYHGRNELGGSLGPMFTARGSYRSGAARIEEIWAFTVHPRANRLLVFTYRYPAGDDSAERASQLLHLLGEVEPLDGLDSKTAAGRASPATSP